MTIRRPKHGQSPAHKRSPRQEAALAKRHGGTRVPGSGNQYRKGDVKIPKLSIIEAKCTADKSFRVNFGDIAKLETEALGSGVLPIMHIEFVDLNGKVLNACYVIPKWSFDILLDKAKS